MWKTKIEEIEPGKVDKYKILLNDQVLTYAVVVVLWQTNRTFRQFFISILKENSFEAYFWETRPVTIHSWNQPFEFVLVNSPGLAKAEPEPNAFKAYFENDLDGNGVVSFPNLGGDAALVVPCPMVNNETYTHLANFVRQAPEAQVHALWENVGDTISDLVSEKPTWLSTAGFGVFWLHIRLDSRPKYYRYQPYKTVSS